LISGNILQCNTTAPLVATKVVLTSDDGLIQKGDFSNNEGLFQLQVVRDKAYQLYAQKENYFSNIEQINPANYDRSKSVFIKLELCGQAVDCNKGVALNNLLFEVAKYDLNTKAKKELDKLVRFLIDNPLVKVELGSHTDSRGTTEDNQKLSQKRAEASVGYIVSKGISANRILAKGYGESILLNNCTDGNSCKESEHAVNRRTEIRLICN
jgi:outer membrane protein OmpA-like peptidoglycan-associated protein